MYPTFIGVLQLCIGSYLLLGRSIEAMLAFVMISTLFGGSAALILPALGGASVLPALFALAFLGLRIALPSAGQMQLVGDGFKANAVLLLFVGYGVVSAFTLPFIFEAKIGVVPLKPVGLTSMYDTTPLKFTNQNATAAMNMVGTIGMGVLAYVSAKQPRGAVFIVKTAVWIGLLHVFLGVTDAAFGDTGFGQFLQLFRNGSYNQLDQSVAGIVRIKGIHPEPSVYAAVAAAWFVFLTECWLRGIMPRRTGTVALLLFAVMMGSTSSTAYVVIAVYAVLLFARMLILPGAFSLRQILGMVGVLFSGCLAVMLMMLLEPKTAKMFYDLLIALTLDKGQSSSGQGRLIWALQGFKAFTISGGLGIGAGSFRSSSIFTAILGSMGIVGIMSYLIHLIRCIRPLNPSTYFPPRTAVQSVGVAASWTVLLISISAGIGAPSPDPGLPFAMFGGVALALREPARSILSRRRSAPVPFGLQQPAVMISKPR